VWLLSIFVCALLVSQALAKPPPLFTREHTAGAVRGHEAFNRNQYCEASQRFEMDSTVHCRDSACRYRSEFRTSPGCIARGFVPDPNPAAGRLLINNFMDMRR